MRSGPCSVPDILIYAHNGAAPEHERTRHWFARTMSGTEAVGFRGNRTSDAHLAALAVEHGATLCSRDDDFRRFPGLMWLDPLDQR